MADVEIYQVTFGIHSALGRCISHPTNLMSSVTTLCCLEQSQREKSERVLLQCSPAEMLDVNLWAYDMEHHLSRPHQISRSQIPHRSTNHKT